MNRNLDFVYIVTLVVQVFKLYHAQFRQNSIINLYYRLAFCELSLVYYYYKYDV